MYNVDVRSNFALGNIGRIVQHGLCLIKYMVIRVVYHSSEDPI